MRFQSWGFFGEEETGLDALSRKDREAHLSPGAVAQGEWREKQRPREPTGRQRARQIGVGRRFCHHPEAGGHGSPNVERCQRPIQEKDVDSAQITGKVPSRVRCWEDAPTTWHQAAEGRYVGLMTCKVGRRPLRRRGGDCP